MLQAKGDAVHDETSCAKANVPEASNEFRSLTIPVHRASTVVFDTVEEYRQRRRHFYDGYSYGLYGTPTSRALEAQIAALEGGTRCLVVGSGMAAITLVLLASARAGDHVLIPDTVYDPVRTLADGFLAELGISSTFYDPRIGRDIDSHFQDRTRLVWLESPGSVTMEVQDVPAIVAAAHERGILVGVDNTWATPLRLKALDLGVDFSMSAVSKYLGGHSDLLMGSVAVRDETLYRRLRDTARHLGYGASPDDCSLALRGIETLAVRLDRVEATALAIARRLSGHQAVATVLHPSLPDHPDHLIWKRDFRGSSGLFTVELQPWTRPTLAEAVESMKHFAIGASWGGTQSIVAVLDPPPVRTATSSEGRGPFLRLSIGVEHIDDLVSDIDRALAVLSAARSVPLSERKRTDKGFLRENPTAGGERNEAERI